MGVPSSCFTVPEVSLVPVALHPLLPTNCTMVCNLPPLSVLGSGSQGADEPVGRCLTLLCHTIELLSTYILQKYKQYKNWQYLAARAVVKFERNTKYSF